jgi:NAD(P)-dependent dehydrogenase (short-subunit alcohol dehydrogenase family)
VATPMILNERLYKQFRPDLEHPTLEDAKGSLATLNLLPVPYIESQDVSNAILFLVAETGRYITGVALPIDAGALAK